MRSETALVVEPGGQPRPVAIDGEAVVVAAARGVRHCRQDLRLLNALVGTADGHPRQAKRIAARLNRHLKALEADIGEFPVQLALLRDKLARAQTNSNPSTFPDAESVLHLSMEPGPDVDQALQALEAQARSRRIWLSVSAISSTVAAVCAFWVAIIYQQLGKGPTRERSAEPPATSAPVTATAPTTSPSAPVAAPDFSQSVDQLNNALERFPTESPQQVLIRVRDENAARGVNVCSFEWNNGEPRLLFGNGRGHVGLASVMGRCAQAVDQAARPTTAPPDHSTQIR